MGSLDVAKWAFRVSCITAIFIYGIAAGTYRLFPYSILAFAKDSLDEVFAEKETLTGTKPTHFLMPARYAGNGLTKAVRNGAVPGLTFISGFFDGGNEMRLLRLDGTIVHRWPVKFSDIFPRPDHITPPTMIPQTDWNAEIHGSLLLPDGSVVFNFEYGGTVKLDRCGVVQWTVPRMTHHSIEPAADGGFWVGSRIYREKTSPFPLLPTPFFEDTLLKVSANGAVEDEISVPGLLFENGLRALLFSNGLAGVEVSPGNDLTIMHLNDVEELGPVMAKDFPQFQAGDLLVSLRDLNMIMVIDWRTRAVKWHHVGPWIGQHDPDFKAGGHITVFNNNNDGTPTGSVLGGSQIVDIDPAANTTRIVYGADPGQHMFSNYRSKHQNVSGMGRAGILIVESEAGRIVEVDHKGDIVWELINRYDEDEIAIVNEATRIPDGYLQVQDWSCN
jgi:hypothetical protein